MYVSVTPGCSFPFQTKSQTLPHLKKRKTSKEIHKMEAKKTKQIKRDSGVLFVLLKQTYVESRPVPPVGRWAS